MGSVIEVGDKIHIMARRLFEEDIRRHFVGEVTATSATLVETRGFTFIYHSGGNTFTRLPEERTRIFSLGDSGYVVNKLPEQVDVGSITYQTVRNRLVVTDGKGYALPINEFGPSR